MKEQILKLGRNSVIYGLGTVVTRMFALLLLPLFTAYLTPGDYGVLAMVMMLGQVVQPIFALGLGAGMGPCYYAGDDETRKSATVWTAFLMLILSSVLLLLAAWIFSSQIGRYLLGDDGYESVVWWSLAAIAVNNLSTPFTLRLQFEDRAAAFVLVTVVSTVVTFAASALAVVVLKQGVMGMVLGQLAGYAVGTMLSMLVVARSMRFAAPRNSLVAELLRLGLPLVPSFAFLFVILHGNKYFLNEMSGLHAVGLYSVGFSIGMAVSVVTGAIQTAWYPYFMSYMNRQLEAPPLFSRVITYYTFAVGGIVLLFFVGARPVLHVLTQPAFHDAYVVVGLVAAAQFFMGLFSLMLPPLYFASEVKYVSVVQCASAVVLCALSLVLVPWLSYLGAALALCGAGLSLVMFLAWWNVRRGARYLQVPIEAGRILPFAIFAIVLAIALLLPYPFVWWQQALVVPFSAALIALCIFLLLGKGERDLLRQLARRTTGRTGTVA